MDGVYNALDVLNFGAPGPLRAALAQLDGEIYADVPSVAIGMGRCSWTCYTTGHI